MEESKSEDWLPPGWTVKVKVRDNGRKDKYYYAPSNGPTFNSRVEVSRYLATALNNHHQPEKKNKGTFKQAETVVVVEKAKAEGLPSGWIQEVRVRKSANAIRRDPYYIDPVSKHVFRSRKAVFRYLETEELEMFTQNSEGSRDKELEDDKTFSTDVIKEQKLAASRARRHINFDQSSDMDEIEKEEQNSSSQLLPPSEHASEQCEIGTELSNSDMQEAKVSKQNGEEDDSSKSTSVLVPADKEVISAKKSLEDGISPKSARAEPASRKSKKKKVPELPRRASKRLAGLEVDPVPELKPRTRARRVAVKQSDDGGTGTHEDSSHGNSAGGTFQHPNPLEIKSGTKCTAETSNVTKLSQQSNKIDHISENLAIAGKWAVKLETITKCNENQGCHVFSLESQNSPYEQQRNVETDDKANIKLGIPLDLPLGELLTDPCIAFAIKTLTGMNFDSSESSEVLPGSISSEHSSANLATELFKVETDNTVDRKQGSSGVLPSGDVPIPEELSESDTKADEKSGSPFELPFEGSWQDPCIEFAIKTLTDAIPLDYDPNVQQCFQQQLSSARTGGSDDTSLTSVGIDNFCQTEYSCQQFHDVEKPDLTQQLEVRPAFPHSGTVSIQNSRQPVRNQHGNERQ